MKSPPPGHSYRLPMPLPPHRTHETRPPSSHEAGCDLHVAKTPNENEHDHSPLHIWHPVVGGVQETDDPDPLPDPETELSPDPALESFVPSPDPLRPTTVPPQAADRPKIRTSAPLRIARRSMNNPTSSIRHLIRRGMVGERGGTVKLRRRSRPLTPKPNMTPSDLIVQQNRLGGSKCHTRILLPNCYVRSACRMTSAVGRNFGVVNHP